MYFSQFWGLKSRIKVLRGHSLIRVAASKIVPSWNILQKRGQTLGHHMVERPQPIPYSPLGRSYYTHESPGTRFNRSPKGLILLERCMQTGSLSCRGRRVGIGIQFTFQLWII